MEDNQLNKEPKKILMVHNFYQIGGGEHTVFTNEVKLLRDHGHEVVEYTRSNDELKDSKIKLLLSPFSTIWSFKTYREVKRIIKEQHIDIVHCHNTFPLISPSVYYAARKCGVPVVQTIHNFRFLCPNGTFFCDGKICEKCKEKNSFKDALKNRCYRDSKIQTFIVVAMLKIHRALGTYKKINYIFLTDFNKEKFSGLIDINGGNVFVKPNFVNEERKVGHSIKDKMFIYAGRLEENKGVRLILQRWDLLPDKYHLRIYGDGELKNYVESVAATHRNIEYFGFQPQQVIFEDLATASALVFPSIWYEGFPMIIAESLSIGCPVLATNIGNHADVIKESDGGVLFDPDDVEGFEKSVDKIIKENQKLSVNARRYFTEHLNKTTNCLHLQNIYDAAEIVGGGGGYEENKELVFIFMGRLEDNKGIVSLINMWKMIPGNYVLHIYGEGTHHDFVEEVCNSNDNIKYYGFQIHDVIFEDMRRAIAVIIPSEWYEPFGMSIPESFSKGIPVISTNLGNPGAMIEKSRAGATYKVDDYISFKQAIDTVVRNRAECSINALAYYRTHLCSEVNYIASESIYNAAEIGGGYSEVDEKYVFVFAGRLEEAKGILPLIEAWETMPKDYELHIYGDGEYREFVIEHTKKNRNINYYGFKDRETVAEDQSNSVATIVSSECYETFGMAIPECFSMGIPVLATDVGNPGQMVKESGGGRTFISQDINSLKEAIDEVILNREKYASAAFEYYKLYLNAENNYKRLMDIYVKARHFG